MRLRIQLITLMRIGILPFNLMQIHAAPDPDQQHRIKVKIIASVIKSSKCSYALCFLDILFANADAGISNYIFYPISYEESWVLMRSSFLWYLISDWIYCFLLDLLFYIFFILLNAWIFHIDISDYHCDIMQKKYGSCFISLLTFQQFFLTYNC